MRTIKSIIPAIFASLAMLMYVVLISISIWNFCVQRKIDTLKDEGKEIISVYGTNADEFTEIVNEINYLKERKI